MKLINWKMIYLLSAEQRLVFEMCIVYLFALVKTKMFKSFENPCSANFSSSFWTINATCNETTKTSSYPY